VKRIEYKRQISIFIDRLFFKDVDTSATMKRKINFFCPVWGDRIGQLSSCIIPTFLQPGNIPRIHEDGYIMELVLYTRTDEDIKEINSHQEKLDRLRKYMSITVKQIKGQAGLDRNDTLIVALRQHLEKCYEENAWFFLTPPDTFFGNHSLANAMKLVEGKDVCLACPHTRVNRDSVLSSKLFKRFSNGEINFENAQLVDFAFRYGHKCFVNSFDHRDENTTRDGLSIRAITDNSYAVVMNLPSPLVISVKKNDIKFFKRYQNYNEIDKLWPRMLIKENRIKVVGSSDLVFSLELTELDKSVRLQKNNLYNDKVMTEGKRTVYNLVCNSFYCVWRRESIKELEEEVQNDQVMVKQ